MKKVIYLVLILFTVSGCSSKIILEVEEYPLNLFNDEPSVVVEGEPEEDPLGLFNEAEELEQKETSLEEKNEQFYSVIKVVDGDTIDIDIDGTIERIRLIGIDTPETVDPRKPVQCFGKEASAKAKEWFSGKQVALEIDDAEGDRGKHGRLLRYVRTKNGFFYNLEIIKQGYAYEYTYDTTYKYQQEFKDAEKYAMDNELGLWAPGVCDDFNNKEEEEIKESEKETKPIEEVIS